MDYEKSGDGFESEQQRRSAGVWYLLIAVMIALGVAAIVPRYTDGQANADGDASSLSLVAAGSSPYRIVVPAQATASIWSAANELQRCVSIATGVTLEIQADANEVDGPFISIGATIQALDAGFDSTALSDGGYRIVTRGDDLFIYGPDTPDGGWTDEGGESHGSANGVYAFLYAFLEVRWLMPGDIGRDVPVRNGFEIPALDQSYEPPFKWREITHLTDFSDASQRSAIEAWQRHMRLGSSLNLSQHRKAEDHWQHNWRWLTDNDEYYESHPEWFAVDAEGNFFDRSGSRSKYIKLETTNPELIEYFANRAVEVLKASEQPRFFSLSPNDAPSRWSERPQTVALLDPPQGSGPITLEFRPDRPSMSSVVFKWYHDVATKVAEEYPEGRLNGFIYSDYIFPPVKFTEPIPSNLTLIFCAPNYGYELYAESAKERLASIFAGWYALEPGEWYYYDLPSLLFRQEDADPIFNFAGSAAILTPVAAGNLEFLFEELAANEFKGCVIYGSPAWSNAAITNYVLASLLWNPLADPEALQREWLERAYGAEAAAVLTELYEKLDAWYAAQDHIGYHLTTEMMRDIYAPNLPEIEALLLVAASKPKTPQQQLRFELFENNVIALQWRLRNMGLVGADYASDYTHSDAEVIALIESTHPDIVPFPGGVTPISMFRRFGTLPRLEASSDIDASTEGEAQTVLPHTTPALIVSDDDRTVSIVPREIDHGSYAACYVVLNEEGSEVISGIFEQGVPVTFEAEAGRTYTLHIPPRKRRSEHPIAYVIEIPEARLVEGQLSEGSIRFANDGGGLYAYSESASQQLEGDSGVQITQAKE